METKENEQDMHDDVVNDDLEDIQIGFCKLWSCGSFVCSTCCTICCFKEIIS